MSEFDKKVQALQMLLATAREQAEENPEQLIAIMPHVFQALTQVYEFMYQWYISIGSPGGESREAFNEWLKTVKATGLAVPLERKYPEYYQKYPDTPR